MSKISIPSARDPHGNMVPIEEAIRHKLNYYTCPECGEFVNPRKGSQRQYFAHKKGVLDDTTCSLSSQADVDRMVDDLRESDIEKEERERSIRIHLGEEYEGHLACFGVIPSLEWGHIPPNASVDNLLDELEIQTSGIQSPPVPRNFHPSEPETSFNLDPTADKYYVKISGPSELDALLGEWTADGFSDGDLFVGDQTRARRHRTNRQIKQGEWVYLVMQLAPASLPDIVEKTIIGEFDVLAFPARRETEDLLERHGEGLTTDTYGFDADILLPADTHPTIEAPIGEEPQSPVLVGVIPSEGIDPVFEVVSIPKEAGNVVDIEPTGPGNPRYWTTEIPREGSRRISIHQRNSTRHRLVHLHAEPDEDDEILNMPATIGLTIHLDENDSIFLNPLGDTQSVRVDNTLSPAAIPTMIEYDGPDGLELSVTANFSDASSLGPTLRRTTKSLVEFLPELEHWVRQGCETVGFEFDGIGMVSIKFSQPAMAEDDMISQ